MYNCYNNLEEIEGQNYRNVEVNLYCTFLSVCVDSMHVIGV